MFVPFFRVEPDPEPLSHIFQHRLHSKKKADSGTGCGGSAFATQPRSLLSGWRALLLVAMFKTKIGASPARPVTPQEVKPIYFFTA